MTYRGADVSQVLGFLRGSEDDALRGLRCDWEDWEVPFTGFTITVIGPVRILVNTLLGHV